MVVGNRLLRRQGEGEKREGGREGEGEEEWEGGREGDRQTDRQTDRQWWWAPLKSPDSDGG